MVVIAAVMLAAAAPAAAPAGTTCEQLESVARSCTGYLKRSLIFLNDACCDGAESVYDALTTDAAVDLGFVCRCLRGFVISESLRPYLYRRDESRQRMFDHLAWGVPDRAVDC
uniref:Bifunctional inhibitor/plant lipid transfer protein/seed storage helical domain-containing protein n=1 Tax=Oryza barthii TaxID=65489 RepID=A0A0D3FLN7_9ORYZ